ARHKNRSSLGRILPAPSRTEGRFASYVTRLREETISLPLRKHAHASRIASADGLGSQTVARTSIAIAGSARRLLSPGEDPFPSRRRLPVGFSRSTKNTLAHRQGFRLSVDDEKVDNSGHLS